MNLYSRQRRYFEHAYRTGEHGWPVTGASPPVVAFLRDFHRRCPPAAGRRVLDIGCGEGRHTILFAAAGYEAIGVDNQPRAIERARRFAAESGPPPARLRFALADVFHLPFPPGSFDVVLDYGCLHHVRKSDFARYRAAVVPLLRPDGYLLLSCFSTRFKHHPGERRTRDWLVHRGHYDRFFRKDDFARLFGTWFGIEKIEELRDGTYAFWHVRMRKKETCG